MKKNLICFILILSLVIPLFVPFFSVTAKAEDSVSINSIDDFYNVLVKDTMNNLGNYGIVAADYFWNWGTTPITDSFLGYYAEEIGLDTINTSINDFYNYCVQHDLTTDELIRTYGDDIIAAIKNELPYYIYKTIPIDKFFSFYDFSNYSSVSSTLGDFRDALTSICSDSNNIYILSQHGSSFNYLYDTSLVSISTNYLEDYAFTLYQGDFSIFPTLPYQSIVSRVGDSAIPSYSWGFLKLYNGVNFADTSSLDYWLTISKNGGNDFSHFQKASIVSSIGPTPSDLSFKTGCVNSSAGWFSNFSFLGSSFISVGSSIDLLVFKSGSAMNTFYSGNSKFYSFNTDIDLSKYPGIDYSQLYDIISENLNFFSGSLGDTLNEIADDYLQEQIELLGDIKNALNDNFGRSWLRRIYNLLDDKLDSKISDLISAINHIDGGSGSSPSMSATNDILRSIDTKLFLMLGILVFDNPDDMEDGIDDWLSCIMGKMPFCLVTDIVVLISLFNVPAQRPDFTFPIPFQNESFTIDISFYDRYCRQFVNAFLIVIFLIFLTHLTIKIFSSLKD